MTHTSLWSFLRPFFIKQKWGFIGLILAHLGYVGDQVIYPYFVKWITDTLLRLTPGNPENWAVIMTPLAVALGFWVLLDAMYRVYDFMCIRIFPRLEQDIRLAMFKHIQQHDYQFFSDHFSGSISNKINDMTQSVTAASMFTISMIIPTTLSFLLANVIFFTFSPMFSLLITVWYIVHLGSALAVSKNIDAAAEAHSEAQSDLVGKIVDSITNMLPVKLFARQRYEYQYIKRSQETERQLHQTVFKKFAYLRLFQGIICFLMMGLLFDFWMIHAWQQGSISSTDTIYIFLTTWNIVVMAWMTGSELPTLFKHFGTCQQAFALIKTKSALQDKANAATLQVRDGAISFQQIRFAYTKNAPLFQDFSVDIPAGQKVGLVGFSGSGKTSFVNLLLRFYDVQSGQILIDEQNIAEVTQNSLREQISMIPQEPTLFHRSLFENIQFGHIDASPEAVYAASSKAKCDDFIQQQAEGYDTLVGERGIKLSGGQRQRISIARAILKNAPILVLDEATSALDSATEKDIQDSLKDLMNNRTTIVIAHRLSTLKEMDRLLVFHEGNVIEDGTHQELLAKQGHYAMLWNMQVGGFLPETEEDS